jgi:hypothetical protein
MNAVTRRRLLAALAHSAGAAMLSGPSRGADGAGADSSRPAYTRSEIPMFKDVAEARAETVRRLILEGGIEPPVTVTEVERILTHLAPQFWIGAIAGGDTARGRTRFGGAPDLPGGTPWPLRPIPRDAQTKAAELTRNFAWIARHVVRELPFEFLAQIDLAEAGMQAAATGLPDDGRLLFFWDGVLGLMFAGAAACHVIWDRAPPGTLERLAVPPVMDELERAYDPSGKHTKPYVYPSRAMRLEPILHLPHAHDCEMLADEALSARLDDDEFAYRYSQLLIGETGPRKRPDHSARRQRLMGTPDPEQRDPRLHVIDKSDLPPGPWSPETLRIAVGRGLEWQLLLQLDLADLAQNSLGKGTVYFLIRCDDLARRDFARVHAVQQET